MDKITHTTTADNLRVSIAIRVPVLEQDTVITIERSYTLDNEDYNKQTIAALEKKIQETARDLDILQIECNFLKNFYKNTY
jgi:hypothetical protein